MQTGGDFTFGVKNHKSDCQKKMSAPKAKLTRYRVNVANSRENIKWMCGSYQ